MHRFITPPRATFPLLALLALLAGCNVYEGLYEEGNTDDPAVLFEDARLALQQDRPEEAVAHLRKALVNTPDSDPVMRKQIQIKLASAVLQVQEINVLRLKNVVEMFQGVQAGSAGKTSGQACLFPQSHAREAFDPTANADFKALSQHASQDALDESAALIARVFSGDETATDTAFPCQSAALDEAVADLQAEGLSGEEVSEALINFSVSRATLAYLDIASVGGGDATFFYVTPPAGEDYVSLCFSDAQTCTDTVAQTHARLDDLQCSMDVMVKRAALLNSSSAQELVDVARDGYQTMSAGLQNATCEAY